MAPGSYLTQLLGEQIEWLKNWSIDNVVVLSSRLDFNGFETYNSFYFDFVLLRQQN